MALVLEAVPLLTEVFLEGFLKEAVFIGIVLRGTLDLPPWHGPMQKQMQTSSPSNHLGEVHGSHQPAEHPQTPRASAGSCAAVRATQLHRCKAV